MTGTSSTRKPVVAIDGPAGAGKSTIARLVARRLGFLYIDTGAMYRSIALKAMNEGVALDDAERLAETARKARIDLRPGAMDQEQLTVLLDGNDVTLAIRSEAVAAATYAVASVDGVRAVLREKQRWLARDGGVVMEGRDVGTAVFPDAEYKFYLDAAVEERARRRHSELVARGQQADLEAIRAAITERDYKDMHRAVNPLRRAPDAIVVDSTSLTIEEAAGLIAGRVSAPREKISSPWLFYAGRFLFSILFSLIWRRRIKGRENIPANGGVIIAPNHMSMADPPLVGSSMKRPLHFMAKQELFDTPVLGFLIRRTNAFPVRRGQQDVGAIRMMQKRLAAGEAVLMFPEGTRSKDGKFGKARPGIGMIAVHAQVPVVPVRIRNSDRLSGFKRLEVVFGKPIRPPAEETKETYQRFAEEILEEIKKL